MLQPFTRLFSPKSIQNKTALTITLLLKQQLQLGFNGEAFGSQTEGSCYTNLSQNRRKKIQQNSVYILDIFYVQHPELLGVGYFKIYVSKYF